MPTLVPRTRDAALRTLREAARAARALGELPDFLAELERVRVEVLLSALPEVAAAPPPASEGGRAPLLTVAQVAERLGRSRSWVYKNRHSLPIVQFPTGGYAFNPEGLDRWIKRRMSGG